jgi:putative membrane protein
VSADLAASGGFADGQWRRLHPLSPLARVGGLAVGIILVVSQTLNGPQGAGNGRRVATIISLALAALALGGGVVSWAVTRWRIHEGDLQLETGLIRRQSIRIPLTRIQAVDIFAPLTARILGLAEVRVISAGRGADRARLAYLRASEAPAVRAHLLALAHGLAAGTPEPPAYLLARVDNGWLAAGLVLRGRAVWGLLVFAVAVGISVAQPRVAAAAGFGLIPAVLGLVGTVRPFNDDYGFTISEAGDGVRLDRGLLQTRHETIPFGRIQAVRLVEPLLWRIFGWCRLEVDVARQHVREQADRDANRVARTLLPVATHEQARWLLARVMPGAELSPPVGSAPPRRARLRALLSFHFLALWFDERHVCTRIGRVRASTVIVPVAKVQSVRLVSGPVQRRLRLATVHVDTAGRRWQASARSRDGAEAYGLLTRIPDLSRQARRGDVQAGIREADQQPAS